MLNVAMYLGNFHENVILTEDKIMAAMLVKFHCPSVSRTVQVTITRCMSGVNRKRNGRETWHARKVPSGYTQYANLLVNKANRKIWKERQDYVNKGWKQTLLDVAANRDKLGEKEAPMLFMVRRVKTLGGRPYWEKEEIANLKLEKEKEIQIFANNPQNCGRLKKVKHLVEILPITFPYGLPESEEDFEHCVLCDNGEFMVKKRIDQSMAKGIETTVEIPKDKWQITQELLDRTLEIKKQKFQIHQEFYPTKYVWKRNEDGKEHRYKGDTNIGADMIWY